MPPETAPADDSLNRPEALALSRELALVAREPGASPSPDLLAAYARAAAPNTLRAFRSDVMAFDLWCRGRGAKTIPATPVAVAGWLEARAGEGAAPASLSRYKASIARLHRLCGLADPTADELVRLTLAAHRREKGVAQKQPRPLRFRGAVTDPVSDTPRGINVRAVLASLGDSLTDLRDKALLSLAYDTGLRASEIVAVRVEDIGEAIDADARLLRVARSKGDQEGEGATAYLSPRSVVAIERWLKAAGIEMGPVFRRVIVRRYAAKPARKAVDPGALHRNAHFVPERFAAITAKPARVEYDVGEGAMHSGSITPLLRAMLQRAFNAGAFGDLDAATFEAQVKQVSAHSTRVGVNQDYFAAGEDLAGIMDALRWKSPRMPLAYNRNLAAEQGAAGRLLGKLR